MKRRHFYLSSTIATLLYILSVWAPSANAATFTSSLPLEPNSLLQPFGETLVVTLPEGFLDLPELPENEYYGNVSYEYHCRSQTALVAKEEQQPYSAPHQDILMRFLHLDVIH